MTPACSHVWINPKDPLLQRSPYSPWIGDQRREMKYWVTYKCQNCGTVTVTYPMVERRSK